MAAMVSVCPAMALCSHALKAFVETSFFVGAALAASFFNRIAAACGQELAAEAAPTKARAHELVANEKSPPCGGLFGQVDTTAPGLGGGSP